MNILIYTPPGERRIAEISLLLLSGSGLYKNLSFSRPKSIFCLLDSLSISVLQTLIPLFSRLASRIRERAWAPLPHAALKKPGEEASTWNIFPSVIVVQSFKNFTVGLTLLCLPASLLSPLFKLFPRNPVLWYQESQLRALKTSACFVVSGRPFKNLTFILPPNKNWCCLLLWE